MILLDFKKTSFYIEFLIIILPISLLFSNLISEILILTLVFVFFWKVEKKELVSILKNKIIISIFILYIFLIINYFLNISRNPDFARSFFFIRFGLYIISLSYFLNKDYIDSKKVFLYWGIIIFLVCIDLQIQNISGKNILGYESIQQGNFTRLGGFLNDELKIANLINNFFVISLGSYFFYNKNNNNTFLFLILAFISIVLFSVYSAAERGNFLTLLIFIFSFLIFSKYRLYFLSIILILIPIILFNISDLKSNTKIKRMFVDNVKIIKKNISPNTEKNKNFLFRDNHYFSHYSTAWQIAKEFPLTGVGIKNFRHYCNKETYLEKIHPSYRDKNCSTHPHNLFFEIVSELGFFGFLVFFIIFGYFFYVSFKSSLKHKNIFLFGNTIFLMTYFIPFLPRGSFFSNWNAMLFWTVFAVSVHLINANKDYA